LLTGLRPRTLEIAVLLDFSKTKIDLRRPISSYAKIQAIVSALIRNKEVFANKKHPGCYLDIGCGPNFSVDFCNLDYSWKPGVDICWDVTKGLPFDDAYIGGVFTEHMLEHVEFCQAISILKECRRVLRVGGVIRIVVPDGQIYLSEYAKHLAGGAAKIPYAESDESRFAIVTPMVSVNRIFRDHGHRFIWDFETLRLALLRCGFSRVDRRIFGEGSDLKLIRDTSSRQAESLYVEAS
jgi:predicted SAM-dependent methyltransferase